MVTVVSERSIEEFTTISISKFLRFLPSSLARLLDSAKLINFSMFLSNTLLIYSGGASRESPLMAVDTCVALPLETSKVNAKVLMSCSAAGLRYLRGART